MRILLPLFIMILFLAFIVWANIYLARRFGYFFGTGNLTPFYLLFAFFTVSMIGGIAGFTNSTSTAGTIFYKTAAVVMGFTLYLLLAVIITDLIALFTDIKPRLQGSVVVILSVVVSLYGIVNAYNPIIKKTDIPVSGIKKEMTIVQLSDIHIGHFRGIKFLSLLVRKTNDLDPDIVVITGDLFDGKVRLKQEIIEPLRDIKAAAFFVDGNHDGYTGLSRVKELVAATGIRVLENEVVESKGLQLVGLNHMLPDNTTAGMHATINGETMKEVLPSLDLDKDKPSLLLHHSPDGIQYASEEGIDVYLTGHTHAGQLFPVNLVNELIFKYNKGLHNYNGTSIYVSQGAGTFGPPMRIGTRSEISLVRLIPAD